MKNIIQKVSTLAFMASAVIVANAQRPAVTVSSVSIAPGQQQTVSIYVDDDPGDSIRTFGTTVTLPRGFTFVKQGNAYAAKGERTADGKFRLIAPSVSTDGDVCHIGIMNTRDKQPFDSDTSKPVVTFTIQAPASFADNATITLSDISLAGKTSYNSKSTGSAYTATGNVVNANVPKLTFSFAGDTLNLAQGGTATVTLNATWPSSMNVTAANGTITLPEGLSFVADEDGKIINLSDARFGNILFNEEKPNGQSVNWVIANNGILPAAPETFATFTVKADAGFAGFRVINASYLFANANGSLGEGAEELAVSVAVEGPTFEFAPDTLALDQDSVGTVSLKVNVPEGTKPTVSGSIALPEGMTFVEGDGTFNVVAEADTTLTFAINAGEAFDGAKEITATVNATSEFGTAYEPVTETIAVTVNNPQKATKGHIITTVDEDLSTGDIYTLALIISGGYEPTDAQSYSADMNDDGEITGIDLQLLINAVYSAQTTQRMPMANVGNDDLSIEGGSVIALNLNNSTEFHVFQFDVTLPEGLEVGSVNLGSRASGMTLFFNKIGDNTWRVLAAGMDNREYVTGNSGNVVTLNVNGAKAGDAVVSNILFVDQFANGTTFDNATLQVVGGAATGIDGINADAANAAATYNLGGAQTKGMQSGVNIVRYANGKVAKVIKK